MKISEAQIKVDDWIQTFGVRYFNELTNLGILVEEVGELSRLLVRKYGEQSFKKDPGEETVKQNIQDEMADVLFVLICLANQMDINLETALSENLKKKTDRDKDRHTNNEKLQP